VSFTDERNLARLRARRFDALYARHHPAICAFVRRRMWGLEADEDDVVADVFAVVWRRLDDVPPGAEELLWVYGVARRCVSRTLRSQRRRTRLGAEAEIHVRDSGSTADSVAEAIRDAIATLPSRDREVLMLVMWERLSHREAAQLLGCSTNAVAIRLHRAKQRLRRRLSQPEPPTEAAKESEAQTR
jgi:RNA polymerase sigma factor (sigma-70 family)